jgi:hypothetical protein
VLLSNRYFFDFGECSSANGFAQVDTKQDASYYGTWANPVARMMVSYAEGDVTRTTCDTDSEFVELVREYARWNDEAGYGPMKIDTIDPETEAAFIALGLGDLLY